MQPNAPVSAMASEHSAFWSKVARHYDAVVDQQIGPRNRSLVRDRVAKEDHLGRLAEFGCGTGFFTRALAERADSVLATDLSEGMLALARDRMATANVTFQPEDCQQTSLADGSFDTAFIGLVIHFAQAEKTLAEMRRILRPGGTLIIVNLDPAALSGLARLRSTVRIVFRGVSGYRTKPPKGFGKGILTAPRLRDLLVAAGFEVVKSEVITDPARSSSIPLDYIKAAKA